MLPETLEQEQTQSSNEVKFQPLSLEGCLPTEASKRMRLNCLGSLYYFIKIGLKRRRLTKHLHKPICDSLEREHLKDLYEISRDHFKSSICSEGLPLWRVLPLTDNDLNEFIKLGYPTEFTRWLSSSHRSEARNLLVSENITNAAKLGKRIAFHYESNAIFRHLFPEIIPTSSETWSNFSLHQRVLKKGQEKSGGHGEGTFDFLGVGSALQSRHYDGIIVQDDLVGRKAIESQSIMDKTIEYHQLMAGAFENENAVDENDELVVGNRWGYIDLNSWIREHEPWFNITSHSALGGCCEAHPPDTPIFPEEFSFDKLLRLKERLGSYTFSCFPAGAPVLMADLVEKNIEDLKVGDDIVGYDLSGYPKLIKAKVEFVNIRRAKVREYVTISGRRIRCTEEHKFLKAFHREAERGGPYDKLKIGYKIVSVYEPSIKPDPDQQRLLDWLGGIIDGEGSINLTNVFISQSPSANPEVFTAIAQALEKLNIEFRYEPTSCQFTLSGGRSLLIRLVNQAKMYKSYRFQDRFWLKPGGIGERGPRGGFTGKSSTEEMILGYSDLGEMDVYNIQSSSGNYVAYGYATKNCQFLNNPSAPENADFKQDDLRYFALEKDKDGEWIIQYEVFNGIVKKDYKVSHLNMCLVTDPNHSGNSSNGRCRHSIVVLGLSADGDYHLVDCWAQGCNFDTYINEIYKMADKWKIRKIGVESVAAQKYLIYHINYRNKLESRTLRVIPLEGEIEAPDGTMTRKKEWRIRNILSPIFESGHFYTQKKFTDFLGEFQTFPKGRFVDILDAMAYAPQLLKLPQGFLEDIKMRAMNNSLARKIRQPYSVGV